MIYKLGTDTPDLPESGDYWVADTANVIGKVRLGSQSSVWFGATLRGDNEWISIGDGSNIQENAVLHTDPGLPLTVGKNCTVGHGAILHGCTLGDHTLVGMGATVLNGAVIGNDCLIGAGALVTEVKTFPAGSLIIGSPAKAVRALTDTEISVLAKSAQTYRARANVFMLHLQSIK